MSTYSYTVYIEVRSMKGETHARNKLLRAMARAELDGEISHFAIRSGIK